MWDLLIRLFGNSEWEDHYWEKRFLTFLQRHPWLYSICVAIEMLISLNPRAVISPTSIFYIAVFIFIIFPIMALTALLAIYLQ